MLFRRFIAPAALVALALPATPVRAASTLLTFEDLPAATTVTTQYGARGVVFNRAWVASAGTTAHSPTRVLYAGNPAGEFHPGAMTISFSSGQRLVRLFAGVQYSSPVNATLTAYNSAGTVVGRVGPRSVSPGRVATLFELTTATAVIRRVDLLYDDGSFEIIDDLEFDGSVPPPVPTSPPLVAISAPLAGQQFSQNTTTVQGTITGPQVTSAKLTVRTRAPLGSTANTVFTYPLTLAGTGDVRTYSQTVSLGLGEQTVTVEAENTAALRGSTSIAVDYLPSVIRARYTAEGGALAFGAFSFGAGGTAACTYAVWANAAVGAVNGTTFVVRGPILAKWLSVQDSVRYPRLGCPFTEQRTVFNGALAQDFRDARLYGLAPGSAYVPTPFAAAIDALGGEAGVGLPLGDPIADTSAPFYTWKFQQFQRPEATLLSTLEIRGDPPRLYVQRQAGDGSLFDGVRRASNPTLVDVFDCQSFSGPCNVVAPTKEPPFLNPASYCNDTEFNWADQVAIGAGYTPSTPEWASVFDPYDQTPLWGVVSGSHRSSGDNPFAHSNSFDPCPLPTIEALANETICPSDWDIFVRPLYGYRWMQSDGRDHVAVEIEQYYAQHFFIATSEPLPGDVLYAAGRMIVDCGHRDPEFKTEIHPPSILAAVRTVTYHNRPATQADIFVNAFFPGGPDALTFDLQPPPRPSPTATLGVVTPLGGALRVTVDYTSGTFGPLHVTVSAPRRLPNVTPVGEMEWPDSGTPGGYEGRVTLFWNE